MKKILLTGTIMLLTALQLFAAADNAVVWGKANELYKQKQYDSAAAYFEQIATLKPQNAEVYYNLGNTYYRLNKVALAVLNYERALHTNPEYKEAKENLLLTQNRIANHVQPTNDIFFVAWWNSLTNVGNATLWAVLALITFVVVILIMLVNRFQKADGLRIPNQVAGVLIFAWICMLVLAYASAQSVNDSSSAVVMQNDAPLMAMEQKGKPLSLIPEGTTVKIKSIKGDFAEVTLPDGRSGWMQQNVLNKI